MSYCKHRNWVTAYCWCAKCESEVSDDLRAQLAALTLARQRDAEEMGRLKERAEMATRFEVEGGTIGRWEQGWYACIGYQYVATVGSEQYISGDPRDPHTDYPTADAAFAALAKWQARDGGQGR